MLEPLSRRPDGWRILQRLAIAPVPLLFLDLDGTLAPLVARPENAAIPGATRATLTRLRKGGARIVLVSGRTARDAARIARVPVDGVLGNHGAECLRGRVLTPWLAADPAPIGRSARRLGPLLDEWPGAWLENKGYSLALHYGGRPERMAGLLRETRRLLRDQPVVSRAGRRVIDIRLEGVDKGRAVLRWLAIADSPGTTGGAALYAGDDSTDEDAFRALRSRTVTIVVGRRADGARFRTASPRTLAGWLARLAAARRSLTQSPVPSSRS